MRYFIFAYVVLIIAVVAMAGFRGSKFSRPPLELFADMDRQPRLDPQEDSDFFAAGQGARKPLPGTIPMGRQVPATAASAGLAPDLDGYGLTEDYLGTGKMGEYYGHGFPEEVKVDRDFLRRGQTKFNIYCAICHGESANGAGVISKYGLVATNLIIPPVADPEQRPDGNIYDVIVNGRGLMGAYGSELTLGDRWAVVAYVRTLQQRVRMPAAEAEEAYEAWETANQEAE